VTQDVRDARAARWAARRTAQLAWQGVARPSAARDAGGGAGGARRGKTGSKVL